MSELKTKLYKNICSAFGTGYLSPGPGTWASAYTAAASYLVVTYMGNYWLTIISVFLFCIGLVATDHVIKNDEDKDPSWIVIDELAGQSLAFCYVIAPSVPLLLLGFVLFRFFDILKPWPIRWIERKAKGAYGVMLDDMVAGLITGIILIVVQVMGWL